MLNRRILRIKAFKALYTYAENPSMSLSELTSIMEQSCEATRSLYLLMLSIVSPLTQEAKSRPAKHFPKFENNFLAPLLDEDPDFQKIVSKRKLAWTNCDVLLRKLFDSICSKDYFAAYNASETSSPAEDAKLFVKIFEEEFVDNADVETYLEDLSIFWIDDLAYALTFCCRTVENLAKGARWSLLPLYQSEMQMEKKDSDKAFITSVLNNAYSHFAEYTDLIAASVPKWDKSRLFVTDQVLIIAGLAEAAACPDIPAKVTINEYVEISKYYGTPNSRSFVNGLLDKLIKENIDKFI